MSATQAPAKRYRVLWPCVTCRTAAGVVGGMFARGAAYVIVTLYRDGWLPADCPQEDIDRLLDKGAIEEVE